MRLIKHQNAASSLISVTGTATNVFTLMDTAGSVTNSKTYFLAPGKSANGIILSPEDGDIRVLNGVNPTSSAGFLCKQGAKYVFSGSSIEDLRLIRTGGSNVAVSVFPFVGTPGEGFSSVADNPTITVTLPNEGQQSMANSISVAVASDQSPISVSPIAGQVGVQGSSGAVTARTQRVVLATNTHTYAETTVEDSASSVALLAANSARGMATIRNGSTARMYISKTATATTSSPIFLDTGEIYELPIERNGDVYKGGLTAIWASDAGGSAYVEESTLS